MITTTIGVKKSTNPTGTRLIHEALAQTPNLPSRTLARALFSAKANLGVWPTLDSVYSAIRLARGARGDASRKIKNGFRGPPSPLSTSLKAVQNNPFYIPPNDENVFLPHCIAAGTRTEQILVMSDCHFPYHHAKSIQAALQEGRRRAVSTIILNGDQLDFHQLSRFVTDPRKKNTREEIEIGKSFLEMLREQFPKARIVWKDGNHDERFMSYLMIHCRELIGVSEFRLEILLDMHNLGVEYVTDKRPISVGKLAVVHGHEFAEPTIAPVNAARWLFLRAKDNALCGHFHHSSEHIENTLKQHTLGCWSTGALCELHPQYRPLNRWNHGFAIINLAPNGEFEVENKKIINGRLM